jgi:hypothetical protein
MTNHEDSQTGQTLSSGAVQIWFTNLTLKETELEAMLQLLCKAERHRMAPELPPP